MWYAQKQNETTCGYPLPQFIKSYSMVPVFAGEDLFSGLLPVGKVPLPLYYLTA